MKTLFRHIRRFLLGLGIVALAGLCACGAGGGNVTPSDSGGGGGVIAVEIPAVNDVNDLVYITGPVVAGAGANLSAKSAANMSKSTSKVLVSETYGRGDSINACVDANIKRGVLKSGAMPDLMLCLLQNHIAPGMASTVSNIYDGRNHDAAIWVQKSHGVEQARFRFNITKEDDKITQFTMHVCTCVDSQCNISTQTQYTREDFDIATSTVAISSKSVEGNFTSTMAVGGTLNRAVQYTNKSITESSRNENNGNVLSQKTNLLQDATTAAIDGFQRNVGTVSTQDQRIISKSAFSYTGSTAPDAELNLALFDLGAGSAYYIDDPLDQIQCWLENGATTACDVAPYTYPRTSSSYPGYWDAIQGETPMVASDVPAASFSGDEVINCGSIDPTYTEGTDSIPLTIETSKCSGFAEPDSHMECYRDIYGDFAVTPSYNGVTLSKDINAPTNVTSSTPTIKLTTNYIPSVGTFNYSNLPIRTVGQPPEWTSIVGTVDSNYGNWNSDYTVLTLVYDTLYNNFEYSLALSDQSGIDSLPMVPATYYIKYVAP